MNGRQLKKVDPNVTAPEKIAIVTLTLTVALPIGMTEADFQAMVDDGIRNGLYVGWEGGVQELMTVVDVQDEIEAPAGWEVW